MKIKPILFAFLASIILSACSLVKDPSASTNFKRVKYRAHLKLPKNVAKKELTVNSFDQEEEGRSKAEVGNKELEPENTQAKKGRLKRMERKGFYREESSDLTLGSLVAQKSAAQLNTAPKKQQLLQSAKALAEKIESRAAITSDDWWESDPEDWPWKEIILAIIAFLLLALLVYLMVDLFGGVVGAIIGLVLLLLLIYFLIDYLG